MKHPKLLIRSKDTIGSRKRAELFNKFLEWKWKQIYSKTHKIRKIKGIGILLIPNKIK